MQNLIATTFEVVHYIALQAVHYKPLQEVHLSRYNQIEHLDLLIIDDFGMKRLEGQQQNDFEQIIDDRYHKKSLILSSQLAVADWYGVFSNEMLAEACLDRIVHKSLRFELKGDSMRKKY